MTTIPGEHELATSMSTGPAVLEATPPDASAVDPNDTTSILQASQLLGKAATAAGRMTVNDGPIAQYIKAKIEKDARDAEEARQLERLEAWGRETTSVGGVEMTNAEAQEARQRVIANDEAYAQWAVKTGQIREDEKDAFKAAIRRKQELEDKRGRGTLTAAEAQEADQLTRSRAGKAADAATANAVERQRSIDLRNGRNDANVDLRQTTWVPSYGDQTPFQAMKAATPPAVPSETAVAERVLSTGLTL